MRLRHVLRRLMRAPGFALVAVVTLALGIGANSAIFSVIEGVLLKPLPYPQSERLIAVNHAAPGVNIKDAGIAPFLYFTYREDSRALRDIGMWNGDSVSITGVAEPEEVDAEDVTDRVLPVLGVQPAIGRVFTKYDDSPGSPATVVLTYGYWQRRFGGDRGVLGRRIQIDGHRREVIGVLPESFHFLDQHPSLFLPMRLDRSKIYLGNFSYRAVARLDPGVTITEASADATRLIPGSLTKFPPFPGFTPKMFETARLQPTFQPLKQEMVGDIGNTLWVLMGTVGIVLLIACANVANLLLVRADGRQQELAIRAALGAGWGEIARELWTESAALAAVGGTVGLGLAFGGLQFLRALAPAHLPRLEDISIDGAVLVFTVLVSILAGALFGLMPAFRYAAPQLSPVLRAGGRTMSMSRERRRVRSALVIGQVALALVLLISSGLLIRTFYALRSVQPGFTSPAKILTVHLSIPEAQAKDADKVIHMEQQILSQIQAIPGVDSAAITTIIPMDGQGWHDPVYPEGREYPATQIPPLRTFKFVSPDFSRAMGSTLVAGREFTWEDTFEKRSVAMVSENTAREVWGAPQAAVGKRIRDATNKDWREVVGVMADMRDDGVDQKAPTEVLWPLRMSNFASDKDFVRRGLAYVIRSSRTGSQGFLDDVRRAVWAVDPNLPLADVRTLDQIYARSMARTSFTLVMLAIAGAMALLLGIVGLYGVISYSVSQRQREIGIRVALGARPAEVGALFVRQGLILAGLGTAFGVVASLIFTRWLASLLFGVSALDPATFVLAPLGLLVAAAAGSYVPALRALKVDPVEALRSE
jgi:putative ABC transport system permease protein